jgi:hypothetical protein
MHKRLKKTGWLVALLLLGLALPGLTACGGAPALGQPDRPTLVFIYTDG